LLLGRNHEGNVEFLSGKRESADADVYATAAREFDEESGCVLADREGDVSHRTVLAAACRSSRVLW
jgi:8-oxo-dGTP pyrophosphatase MutT (NUDIX family)